MYLKASLSHWTAYSLIDRFGRLYDFELHEKSSSLIRMQHFVSPYFELGLELGPAAVKASVLTIKPWKLRWNEYSIRRNVLLCWLQISVTNKSHFLKLNCGFFYIRRNFILFVLTKIVKFLQILEPRNMSIFKNFGLKYCPYNVPMKMKTGFYKMYLLKIAACHYII